MKTFVKNHSLAIFVVIAYGWTWPLAALIERSVVFPLLALFGPFVAALVVLSVIRARTGLSELANKFRPSSPVLLWSLLAAFLPLVLLVPQWLLHTWWWGPVGFEMHRISFLSIVVALLIVGEEVGWRGFLLPSLLQRHGPLPSGLIVGLVWAVWHVPNFLLPNYPHYGLSFTAFVIMTVAFSLLFTWFYLKTNGSLLVAVIFHAALNLFSMGGVEAARAYWLKAVVYSVAALAVSMLMLTHKRRSGSSYST